MTSTTVRGKTWKTCPKCNAPRLVVVWDREENQTVRRFVCPTLGCPYVSESHPIDRLVVSMIAPHDAAFLRELRDIAQAVATFAMWPGYEEQTRHCVTKLQIALNRLPPDLVAKLEREG